MPASPSDRLIECQENPLCLMPYINPKSIIMKKTIVLIAALALYFNAFAQFTKEHAFNDQASVNIHMVRLENSGRKICVVNRNDSISYQYIFYNPDYTLFKTVSINLGPLIIAENYNSPGLDVSFVAENVFDTDPDIDLLGQLTYYDEGNAEYAQVVVFNQDGSPLFESDIENTNAYIINSSMANSSLISSLTNTDEGAKMILDVDYFNEGLLSYDVYDLPGNIPSAMDEHQLSEANYGHLRAYPVPAQEYVDIEYRLAEGQQAGIIVITDVQGKTLQRIRVTANRGTLRVPLANYKSGSYLYRMGTGRGVPRSGKMIIVK